MIHLHQASKTTDNCKFLVDNNIFFAISTLIEIYVMPAITAAAGHAHSHHPPKSAGDKHRDSMSTVTEVEKHDVMRHLVACILSNLTVTTDRGLDEILVLNGIVSTIQTLSVQLNRIDTICLLIMA